MCGLQHWPILGSSDFLGKDAEHPSVAEEKKEGEGCAGMGKSLISFSSPIQLPDLYSGSPQNPGGSP